MKKRTANKQFSFIMFWILRGFAAQDDVEGAGLFPLRSSYFFTCLWYSCKLQTSNLPKSCLSMRPSTVEVRAAMVVVIGMPDTTAFERIWISSTMASAPVSVVFTIHWTSLSWIRSSRFGRPREIRNTARVLMPSL